jgi:hypothetical protein
MRRVRRRNPKPARTSIIGIEVPQLGIPEAFSLTARRKGRCAMAFGIFCGNPLAAAVATEFLIPLSRSSHSRAEVDFASQEMTP